MFSGAMLLQENHCGMLCFHCVYNFRKTYAERHVFSLGITVVKYAGKHTVKTLFPRAGKLGMNSLFSLC